MGRDSCPVYCFERQPDITRIRYVSNIDGKIQESFVQKTQFLDICKNSGAFALGYYLSPITRQTSGYARGYM